MVLSPIIEEPVESQERNEKHRKIPANTLSRGITIACTIAKMVELIATAIRASGNTAYS